MEREQLHEHAEDTLLGHDDHDGGHCISCCEADCHVITSEDEFQALLKGLKSD